MHGDDGGGGWDHVRDLVVIKGFLFLKKRRRPPCGKQKTLFAVVDFRTARAKKAKVFWFFFSKKNILLPPAP
jgi:hypothetical protein